MIDLEDALFAALAENPATPARRLVGLLRDAGVRVTKSEINAALYRAHEAGTVLREGEAPPLWSLASDGPPSHATAPEWIIERWLDRTGERWPEAQRDAAADGPRVAALTAFTGEELTQALDRLEAGSLTWDGWLAAAVSVRSRSIRV
jgi:hypothetical protein